MSESLNYNCLINVHTPHEQLVDEKSIHPIRDTKLEILRLEILRYDNTIKSQFSVRPIAGLMFKVQLANLTTLMIHLYPNEENNFRTIIKRLFL